MKIPWKELPGFTEIYKAGLLAGLQNDSWDNSVIHVSDIESCARKIWYRIMYEKYPGKFSVEKPTKGLDDLVNLSLGHAYHELIQKMFLINALGWCSPEDVEFRAGSKGSLFRGSIDAIVPVEKINATAASVGLPGTNFPGTHVVLDLKTKKDPNEIMQVPGKGKITKYKFKEKVLKYPDMGYYTQVQTYMGLLEEFHKDLYPDVKAAIILYVNKNTGEFLPVGIPYDQEIYSAAKRKAIFIKQCVETQEAPPREYAKMEPKCRGYLFDEEYKYGCPFYKLCQIVREG